MANSNNFMNQYFQAISQLVTNLQQLRLLRDEIEQDSTLVTRYFSQLPANGQPNPRADITLTDVTNAQSAIVQMLFTFDSGSPTQKSYLYKMLP